MAGSSMSISLLMKEVSPPAASVHLLSELSERDQGPYSAAVHRREIGTRGTEIFDAVRRLV